VRERAEHDDTARAAKTAATGRKPGGRPPAPPLVELSEMLRQQHGVTFAPSAIWRFLDRHAMTVKRRMARPVCKGFHGLV
jgi:hypothetical protein